MTINENKLGLWKISESKGKGILDDDGLGAWRLSLNTQERNEYLNK